MVIFLRSFFFLRICSPSIKWLFLYILSTNPFCPIKTTKSVAITDNEATKYTPLKLKFVLIAEEMTGASTQPTFPRVRYIPRIFPVFDSEE